MASELALKRREEEEELAYLVATGQPVPKKEKVKRFSMSTSTLDEI